MPRRKINIYDDQGTVTGTRSVFDNYESSMFDLYEQEEGCPECGFEGPLELRRRGWRCPECLDLIIPNE